MMALALVILVIKNPGGNFMGLELMSLRFDVIQL